MRKVKIAVKTIKDNGVIQGAKIILNKLINKTVENQKDIIGFYDFLYLTQKKPLLSSVSKEDIKLLWFIPDFGIGSGGHLNIFRMIQNLEKENVSSDIVICGNSQWGSSKIAKEMINNHFFKLSSKIFIVRDEKEINNLGNYSFALATSWQTAYYVNCFAGCYQKLYFVQDFEPYFYSHGSSYAFAENTYKMGFYGISAGNWISDKLKSEYNMSCENFSFSYDRELYSKHKKKKANIKRIFFYARPPTDRRGFELGVLALNKLFEQRKDFAVIFAGWDISEYKIDFEYLNAGIVALDELSDLYAQCDVALVLSFTNLSLLPLELLASGCPVILNDGKNNTWIDSEKKLFHYTKPTINDIVKNLDEILSGRINKDDNYIDNYLSQTSWEKEAIKVSNIIKSLV